MYLNINSFFNFLLDLLFFRWLWGDSSALKNFLHTYFFFGIIVIILFIVFLIIVIVQFRNLNEEYENKSLPPI